MHIRREGRAAMMIAIGALGSPALMAAVDFSASAQASMVHDNNVFQLSNLEAAPSDANGDSYRSDTTANFGASLVASVGDTGPTRARIRATFSRVEFDRQDALSHNDYQVGGSLDWKPSEAFDTSLAGSLNRLPFGLADVGGNRSVQQETSQAQGTVRIRPVPQWQLSLGSGLNETRTPLPGAEDFVLHQTSETAAVSFIGAGRLVPGLSFTRSQSRNSGIAGATRYRDEAIQGTLNYQATGLSTFAFSGGHTRRVTHLADSSDAPASAHPGSDGTFTGSASYTRQITAKTGMHLSAFRYLQQFAAGTNNSVGTGFDFGADWKATSKTSANIDVAYTWSTIDDFAVGALAVQRKDLVRRYSINLNYQALRRVGLFAQIVRNVRTSTVRLEQFSGTAVGLGLTAAID